VKYTDDSWTKPKQGDEIIICGKLVNYKGNTPETVANQSYIYSLNGNTGGGGSTPTPGNNHGTAEAPLTVAQAIALIDAESNISEAYVKGKISQIDSYNSTYKSITYWISDDGGTTTQLQVYSGKGLNGADFTAKEDLTVGKTVVIKGTLKKYNTTYEFDKTSSIISIN
jgi:exonuclease VII large subunit